MAREKITEEAQNDLPANGSGSVCVTADGDTGGTWEKWVRK